MKELKLRLDNLEKLEKTLQNLGGKFREEHWIGNWYLETTPQRVRKIMMQDNAYYYLELEKLDQGFAFTKNEKIQDIAAYKLDEVEPHNVLHKTVRPWVVGDLGVDILLFDDIGEYFCVNYEDPQKQKAQGFVKKELGILKPDFIEVPFNVLKRRNMGFGDFD